MLLFLRLPSLSFTFDLPKPRLPVNEFHSIHSPPSCCDVFCDFQLRNLEGYNYNLTKAAKAVD